jgi:hypothetical protein
VAPLICAAAVFALGIALRTMGRRNRLLECICQSWTAHGYRLGDGRRCNFCGRRIIYRRLLG